MFRCLLAIVAVALVASVLPADERLEGIACRSVHLGYPASEGVAFYNEITVEKSAPGTYFAVCAWNEGYFGIQELANGKKLVIFSVWDSAQNDPKKVDEEKRVKLLHKDEKVRIGRFGGEGTGGQSFLDFDWKIGTTYGFMVTSKINGDRTEYAGYFNAPEAKGWKHMVTFSTITGGRNLGGYYSFVEDFKRDKVSATKVRSAQFGNTWVKPVKTEWEAITKARFTGDKNPVTNINAGMKDGRFFLVTGGDTKNSDTKLKDLMQLPADDKRKLPDELPKID